tara:strand:+ start:66263 stop:66505 length:243 start_codon:yes stop_codon:yes gene_type:complete
MKYRDHQGGLKESMKTVREFSTINELKEHFRQLGRIVEEVRFKHIGIDKRTGWNTYYVLQRLKGEYDFTVAGMSDSLLDD